MVEVIRAPLRVQAGRAEEANVFRLHGQVGQLFVMDRFTSEVLTQWLSGFWLKRLWSSETGGVLLDDSVTVFERFPPGYGTTLREKRQAMRDVIANWH